MHFLTMQEMIDSKPEMQYPNLKNFLVEQRNRFQPVRFPAAPQSDYSPSSGDSRSDLASERKRRKDSNSSEEEDPSIKRSRKA